MQSKRLMSVEVVTDDETGIYKVGEFDYAIPFDLGTWLDGEPERREEFARFLHKLAEAAESGTDPFRNKEIGDVGVTD